MLLKFEMDSRADETVVPSSHKNLSYPVWKLDVIFTVPGKHRLKVKGMLEIPISYRNELIFQKIYLVEDVEKALLGRPVGKKTYMCQSARFSRKSNFTEQETIKNFFTGRYFIYLSLAVKTACLAVWLKPADPVEKCWS